MKLLMFSILFFSSCLGHAESGQWGALLKTYHPKYAKHFFIQYFENVKIVQVDQEQYLLTEKPFNGPLPLSISSLIRIPVNKVAMTSTTYLPALEILNKQKSLMAFQGKHYVVSKKFDLESIKELSFKFNTEDLLSLKADLIMGYEANLNGENQKKIFHKLNMPVVMNKDFEEQGPLARAEWIIFIASFFNQENEANKIFQSIEENYLQLKRSNEKIKKKKVIIGDIQAGHWVTCGGLSDLGQLISDAGGEIPLGRLSTKTQSINLEELALKKVSYDVWLTHNMWESENERREIMTRDPRYKMFNASLVYNNNLILNKNKSSDFWEMALQRPDLLLKDLSAILHPEFYPGHQLKWYRKL